MKIGMSQLSLLLVTSCVLVSSVHALVANREICFPQNADMSQQVSFVSVCDWQNRRPGTDANALITLNGKKVVHAECQFSGPDKIAMVSGSKHSDFKTLVAPGQNFSFDVGYHVYSDGTDDNQNINIYLSKTNPDPANLLVCEFTVA